MPRVIMVMYDTLCRHFIPSYGNDWIKTPNFDRLSERFVQFNNAYVGSMPCMPARREMHTGRYNFLHRGWGPLEPFDDSLPEILGKYKIYSHKVTDHQHYWEDGGATYHQRFSSFEFVRGQEGDKWIGQVKKPEHPEMLIPLEAEPMRMQDWVNRQHMTSKEKQPQHITFSSGIEFIERNYKEDNWYLQIETFDPHEPFFTQKEFQELYPHTYNGPFFDWIPYREVKESKESVDHIRYLYASLLAFCDYQLGRFLDTMDKYNLWESTMVIICTDHGLLMGEHDWWAKCVQPFYQEIAHIPLWIYDNSIGPPNRGKNQIDQLVQTIDLPATILDHFNIQTTKDMMGKSLKHLIKQEIHGNLNVKNINLHRKGALYGIHGGQVNVTDGIYVYMRGCQTIDNTPLFEYTLMPTRMRRLFHPKELTYWEKHPPFNFTKGVSVMQIPARFHLNRKPNETLLFNVSVDEYQVNPLYDHNVEMKMIKLMVELLIESDCPTEQYHRLGLYDVYLVVHHSLAANKNVRSATHQTNGGYVNPTNPQRPVLGATVLPFNEEHIMASACVLKSPSNL